MKWAELRVSPVNQILAWAEGQPWAREMAGCQQDAQWHTEGNERRLSGHELRVTGTAVVQFQPGNQ